MMCPDYDGVPEYGGPCWTCQDDEEHCPIGRKNLIRDIISGLRNTPKRELLHEMIIEISVGVDD